MMFGAPTLADRVAPRCTYADGLLIFTVAKGRAVQHRHLLATIRTPAELTAILEANNVDILVAGGVGASVRKLLDHHGIYIIDNVSQTIDELLRDIPVDSRLRSIDHESSFDDIDVICPYVSGRDFGEINCLSCSNHGCLEGKQHLTKETKHPLGNLSHTERRMLEAATDIAKESPRRLCRLSEIIYFCIEMNYQRIGLAYCTELEDASEILVNVLSRFFHVVPVCCKVGGVKESELYMNDDTWLETGEESVVCNPLGQAHVLNHAETQFNLVVGLCVGADALFTRASKAPASILFVKDKSLANNPIGALYSEYYLKESVSQAARRPAKESRANNQEE